MGKRQRKVRKIRYRGTITVTRRGFAFVKIDQSADDEPIADIFVPPGKFQTAITGDEVEIKVVQQTEKGPLGEVTQIISRNRLDFVGQVVAVKARSVIIAPVVNILGKTLAAPCPKKLELDAGDWINFRIIDDGASARLNIEIIDVIETKNEVSGILDGLTEEFNLPMQYTEEEEVRAAQLEPAEVERKDLTAFTTMTIDPFDAKDFDDALSILAEDEKTVTVGIHIADVAAYVRPGSYFDEKASKRCFTNYLPGRMIPMLPKNLLRDKCSLNADVIKPAHTVEVKISRNSGHVESYSRYHSWIKVTKRLNYDEVQHFFEDTGLVPKSKKNAHGVHFEEEAQVAYFEDKADWHEWSDDVKVQLTKLYHLYDILHQYRAAKEQFIMLIPKEIRILCNEETAELNGLHHEQSDQSHELIEEFMLLANTLVAKELLDRKMPGVYRTHPEPNNDDLVEFNRWLKNAFNRKAGSLSQRKSINRFLTSLDRDDPATSLIMVAFLKTMQRARYQVDCEPHFGLGKTHYLHFTSPIRRYTDLAVHQQLWQRDVQQKTLYAPEHCAAIANACTSCEQNYDEAYWAANDRLKMLFLSNCLKNGETTAFQAMIMTVNKSSLQLYIPDLGMFSEIPYSDMEDFFELNQELTAVRGRESGRVYRIGQIVNTHVVSADPVIAHLRLKIVTF